MLDETFATVLDATRGVASFIGRAATIVDDELTMRVGLLRAKHDEASRQRAEQALARIERGEAGPTVSPDELRARWEAKKAR